jgi:hypothetical protein
MHRLPFTPQEDSWYSFLLIEKKSNDFIGNRTCNLPACSIVPQSSTLPRTPCNVIQSIESQLTYQRNMLPPSSELRSKPSKKLARSRHQAKQVACRDVGLYRNKDDLGSQAQLGLQLVSHSSSMSQCRWVGLQGPLCSHIIPCLQATCSACCQVHASLLSVLMLNPEDRGDKFL